MRKTVPSPKRPVRYRHISRVATDPFWASYIWELIARLDDVRPKLSGARRTRVLNDARERVAQAGAYNRDAGVLKCAALQAFGGLCYRKYSRFTDPRPRTLSGETPYDPNGLFMPPED